MFDFDDSQSNIFPANTPDNSYTTRTPQPDPTGPGAPIRAKKLSPDLGSTAPHTDPPVRTTVRRVDNYPNLCPGSAGPAGLFEQGRQTPDTRPARPATVLQSASLRQRTKEPLIMASIIGFIVIALIAGFAARALVPGKDAMSLPQTLLLGAVGSGIGGLLGGLIGDFDGPAGPIGSIIGAVVALLAYKQFGHKLVKR